ncbi:MAG: hypothetical protein Roseis2KO_48810 [Roseivirga sp.]
MNLEDQLLFFFSALGAFNGIFLSIYFAFFVKKKSKSSYFLSALLFVVSVRVAKSVFMTFYPDISNLFIQVGLSACALIGPFLYLYISSVTGKQHHRKNQWLIHIVPVIIIMVIIGILYPYKEYRWLWQRRSDGYLCWPLFAQWLSYIAYSGWLIKDQIRSFFTRKQRVNNQEMWLINLVAAMTIIWIAYFTNGYTSYIVGALSFSFTFYISVLIWVFKKGKAIGLSEETPRYANKKIELQESKVLENRLRSLLKEQGLYKNPDLKLSDLASALQVAPHYLSQYLNDNLGKSFTTLINEHRVDAAEAMIKVSHHLTLAAIGNECGFKSNSSFYNAFKKFKGTTPASFKKQIV